MVFSTPRIEYPELDQIRTEGGSMSLEIDFIDETNEIDGRSSAA